MHTRLVHSGIWLCSIHRLLSICWVKVTANRWAQSITLLSLRIDTSRYLPLMIFFGFHTLLSFLYLFFIASQCLRKRGLQGLIFSILVGPLPLTDYILSIFQVAIYLALLLRIQRRILNPIHCAFIKFINMFFSLFSQSCPGIHITLNSIRLAHILIKPTAIIVPCNTSWKVPRSCIEKVSFSNCTAFKLWFVLSISMPRWL